MINKVWKNSSRHFTLTIIIARDKHPPPDRFYTLILKPENSNPDRKFKGEKVSDRFPGTRSWNSTDTDKGVSLSTIIIMSWLS